MKKLLAALVLSTAVAGTAIVLSGSSSEATEVTLYKNPQCGCCEEYADRLRDDGFDVTVKPTHALATMSQEAGIPEDFQGCHLAYIDNYVVSGHVPIGIVKRMLDERPDIKGVTLPGMPMGSPGMGGEKSEPFTIYEIGEGSPKIYAVD